MALTIFACGTIAQSFFEFAANTFKYGRLIGRTRTRTRRTISLHTGVFTRITDASDVAFLVMPIAALANFHTGLTVTFRKSVRFTRNFLNTYAVAAELVAAAFFINDDALHTVKHTLVFTFRFV